MSFTVSIKLNKRFKTDCPYDKVFDALADVPYSVEHFPKVEELVDQGDEIYLWKMEKIGLAKYHIQTTYACQYTWDRKEGWIAWEPVEGVGNATVSGKWTLKSLNAKTTQLAFKTDGEIELPLPSIAKGIVGPMVVKEFEGLVDQYFENLKETFAELAEDDD
jgi:carbon monoxide dehydrogenase subunit G